MAFSAGRFKAAVSTTKGTAVTTASEFLCFTLTSITPPYADKAYDETEFEYSCSSGSLTVAKTSLSNVTNYIGRFAGEGKLYPIGLGVLLRGMGFANSTTGASSPYSHELTLEAASSQDWLTIVADSDSAFPIRGTDGRVTSLTLTQDNNGIRQSFEGACITIDEYTTGISSPTDETGTPLSPSADGSGSTSSGNNFELNIASTNVISSFQSHEIVFNNPLDEEDYGLFQLERNDLQPTAFGVTGTLRGVTMTEALYKNIDWGGTTGTGPSAIERAGDVDFTYESYYGIDGTASTAPYSVNVVIPSVAIRRASEPVFTGGNTLRFDIQYTMVADTSTPITVTIVNSHDGSVY